MDNPWIDWLTFREIMNDLGPKDTSGVWLYVLARSSFREISYIGKTSGSSTKKGPSQADSRVKEYAFVGYSLMRDQVDDVLVTMCNVNSTHPSGASGVRLIEKYLQLQFRPFGNYRELQGIDVARKTVEWERLTSQTNPQVYEEAQLLLNGLVRRADERDLKIPCTEGTIKL